MGELSIISIKVQTSITRCGKTWIPRYFSDVDEERCDGCSLCVKACPRGLLTLESSGKKQICKSKDSNNCIGCTACMNSCKNQALFCSPKRLDHLDQ